MSCKHYLTVELVDTLVTPTVIRTEYCNPKVYCADTPEDAVWLYKYWSYAGKAKALATLEPTRDSLGDLVVVQPILHGQVDRLGPGYKSILGCIRKMVDLWAAGSTGRHRIVLAR